MAYITGRLGWRVTGYAVDGPDQDVISADLRRDAVEVHLDWFPRTRHVVLSRGTELLGVYDSFPRLADALESLAP
jgi:hypothetical protein